MKRIRIAISPCLLGRPARYDGTARQAPHVIEMFEPNVEWVTSCPELAIGLGVPRPTIRHELQPDGSVRLIMPERNRLDLTEKMLHYSMRRVEALMELDIHGYVLKSRSPSCGIDDVEVHHPDGQVFPSGTGFFARVLIELMPDLPVTDERRLLDPLARDEWFAQVSARAG